MATIRFRPAARPTAQVTTVQITAYDAATTYKLTVGGRTVSTAGVTGVNATATALAAAWNAATDGEFSRITASAATDTVTLTADDKDLPFTVASSVSGGTGTIGAASTTTAATGVYNWADANNWSGGAVPVTGDVVHLDHPGTDIRYGFAQTGVTLAELHTYSALIGLPEQNAGGYPEYRDKDLAIKATLLVVGEGTAPGSTRQKIDLSTAQSTVRVLNSGTSPERGLTAVMIKGTHASNAAYLTRGEVGFALRGGEAATLATLEVGYQTSPQSDVTCRCGAGVTLTTLQQTGGTVTLEAGLTTVDKRGGTLTVNAGSVTTLSSYGGAVAYRGTGTVGTLNLENSSIDFAGDTRACTVTDATLKAGASVNDPLGRVTWTNPISVPGETTGVSLNLGRNRSIAVA